MEGLYNPNNETNTLLEQYKIAINMADKISDRRATANNFFLTLNSAILAFNGVKTENIILLIGILICIVWFFLIQDYRKLNKVKFKIINSIEHSLSANIMSYEWKILKQDKYRTLTLKEMYIPLIFGLIYFVWIIKANVNLLLHLLNYLIAT
ncbi:hypothetical protein YZ15_04165 [Campylobacter lari]|nr:hypothetical protein [Campylobacter lari]EAK0794638.1 hypothetical protein [Campylobacter lari]EAK9875843.1 hypothetical protein [Campylobacter lari]MCV3394767.1 hypothetical protein [Campylobacter lari]MCV3413448.1 hypothetical protein [Campylobacter lari]